MNAVSWVILAESLALFLLLGWSVLREIVHARTMALVDTAIDELKIELERVLDALKGEVS